MKNLFRLTTLFFVFFIINSIGFAANGYEYWSDQFTLALWHFNEGNGDNINDESGNNIESNVEGNVEWDKNEDWNLASDGASSFRFDGQTLIAVPSEEKIVQPEDAITVEAWVFPESLDGWKLILTHWGGAVVGSYHLGVEAGVPKFHINTGQGTAFAAAVEQLNLQEWQHVAGTYDSNTIRLFINGEQVGETGHGGKLKSGDPDFDVIIGSKDTREFNWNGLLDEVRISSIARKASELSPNLEAPQSVEFNSQQLPIFWGGLKKVRNRNYRYLDEI